MENFVLNEMENILYVVLMACVEVDLFKRGAAHQELFPRKII